MKNETKKILDYLSRTMDDVYSMRELEEMLDSGKKLRMKFGFDITAPDLHIGHAVSLWNMRYLQELGHKVVLLAGDFTTRIGDPSGKDKTRPVIEESTIKANAEKYMEQVKKVLLDDPELLEVRWNSEWYGKMGVGDFLGLLSKVTHANLISRDMFKRRIKEGGEIHMHEMLYPVLQGYDSVELESDLTIIGSDQLFNENMGRLYQEKFGQKPQVIVTTKLLVGLDGKMKMSKSKGNYIGLGHTARDMFGLVMTLSDDRIVEYLRMATDVDDGEIEQIRGGVEADPVRWKKFLGSKLVERYYGEQAGRDEVGWFTSTFSERKVPDDIREMKMKKGMTYFEIVKEFFGDEKSKSEVRRLFDQGAVSVDEEKVGKWDEECSAGVYKVGKRVWFRVFV